MIDRRFEPLGLLARDLADGSRVVVSRYGAQVLSWVSGGQEKLYLSGAAAADGVQPIRGGVPVCFPQFSGRGPLPKHGFARTTLWSERPAASDNAIHLQLTETPETLSLWPHRFTADLHVLLEPGALTVRLDVRNTDVAPWPFSGALHTYLNVGDVRTTRLLGLQGVRVEDALQGTFGTATGESPDLAQPIDSVFEDATAPLTLVAPAGTYGITKEGFADVVVWNPGEAAAPRFEDIGPGESNSFVCVEAAQAAKPVVLQPGQSWFGQQRIRVA